MKYQGIKYFAKVRSIQGVGTLRNNEAPVSTAPLPRDEKDPKKLSDEKLTLNEAALLRIFSEDPGVLARLFEKGLVRLDAISDNQENKKPIEDPTSELSIDLGRFFMLE